MLCYDSGNSFSLVNDSELLENMCHKREAITITDNTDIFSKGRGKLTINVNNINLKLDAMYVPSANLNLISISQLNSLKVTTIMRESIWLIYDGKITEVAAIDPSIKLYMGPISGSFKNQSQIQNETTEDNETSSIIKYFSGNVFESTTNLDQEDTPKEHPFFTDHIMMGHMPIYAMTQHYKRMGIKTKPTKQEEQLVKECQICIKANMKRVPHTSGPQRDKSKIRRLFRLHSDTLGPFNLFLEKKITKKYITTVIDEATGFTEIIVSDSKGVKSSIIKIIKKFNQKFNERVAFFRSDNAPEMPSIEDLQNIGVDCNQIPTYSPSLNGLAEGYNRKILINIYKIVSSLNADNNIMNLFKYMAEYSVHKLNNTPRRLLHGKTPFEKFYKCQQYNIKHLQFGIDCIVKIHTKIQAKQFGIIPEKFIPFCIDAFFVGYGSDSCTFIVITMDNKYSELRTCDVVFINSFNNIKKYKPVLPIEIQQTNQDITRSKYIYTIKKFRFYHTKFPY
ncbi:uncharacterized protein KGF55_004430 [Candida pseudojiufengensis]|uniref:uncharacterized protein n=1 Tax=Candida pseudojiufengensis TaxID=497109 RepID=UPI002225064D|nr:uncharacterized protein KGF55_004430 [Candida pseudojiufengensis]KAI5960860.1 hypothetical protein KGF55_004430 [Candida pseudojiufengensis]